MQHATSALTGAARRAHVVAAKAGLDGFACGLGDALHGSGDTVDNRYATHGCIGLPDEFAALLFRATKLGDRVTVTRNWLPQFYGA